MEYVAFGWYTPDYAAWFHQLEASLIDHGARYYFKRVPVLPGGWERNTCRKAEFVLAAMEEFPGVPLILLDVDCVVTGDLSRLAGLQCDVALNSVTTHKRRRVNVVMQTGHMVLNPTAKMHELMQAWARRSAQPEYGLNDQETLALALNDVHGVSIMHIDSTAYGTIKHFCASKAHGVRKVNGRARFKHRILSALGLAHAGFNAPERAA